METATNGKGEIRIGPTKAIKVGMAISKKVAIEGYLRITTNKSQRQYSGDPELRGMIERMIKNQEKSDKETREMNRVVSFYTTSIK